MKKIFILILFSFLWINESFCQNRIKTNDEKINSLIKKINESSFNDSLKVEKDVNQAIELALNNRSKNDVAVIYYQHGNYYFNYSNYSKAKSIFDQAIFYARISKNAQIENATKIRLAFILAEKDIFSAEKELKLLFEEAKTNNFIENQIEALNGLGQLFEKRQIQDEAMSYYLKALKIAEKENLTYYRASLINNIGIIKLNNNQLVDAESDFKEALKLAQKSQTFRMIFSIENNLGSLNLNQQKIESAIKYFKQALFDAKKFGFERGKAIAYGNLCNSYHFKTDYPIALIYIDSAIRIFKKENDWDYIAKSHMVRANLHFEQNEFDLALNDVDEILIANKNCPIIENYLQAQKLLSDIYEKKGNPNLAIDYLKKYNRIKDSITSTTNWEKLAELQVLYGKEKLEFDLHKEKSINLILAKENELKKANFSLVIIISALLLISIISIYFIRDFRAKKRNQMIFSNKLIENIDDERARISRDLHDDIGQTLSLVKSKIDMFEKNKLENLEEVKNEISEIINQTRDISHNLHPVFISNIGLFRSLFSLLSNTEKSTELICSLDANESINQIEIEKQVQIYRILQECINNTIKHADAKSLKIQIFFDENEVSVNYLDNGVNALKNNKKNGIGLMTIQERTKKIGGKIHYEFTQKGFRLNIKFHP